MGVTSNLVQRIWQHRSDFVGGFSSSHRLRKFIYFELHDEMTSAILREKQLKKWRRKWKIGLIEKENPYWRDLWDDICS